jgi:TPR repeat protein
VKQRIKAFLAGGVLALALFGTAMAGPLEDGEVAYQRGDYTVALRLWRPLADGGNADAQLGLGTLYINGGGGVPQDYAQAHMWFNLSASRATEAEDRDSAAKNRDELAAKMTPDQIAEAQRMAREWVEGHPSTR